MGRRKLPPEEKKEHLQIYIPKKAIEIVGGKYKAKDFGEKAFMDAVETLKKNG